MNRFFVIWFLMFFTSVAFAMETRDDLAINVSLVILSLLGMLMSKDLIRGAFFFLSSINWPTTKTASMLFRTLNMFIQAPPWGRYYRRCISNPCEHLDSFTLSYQLVNRLMYLAHLRVFLKRLTYGM